MIKRTIKLGMKLKTIKNEIKIISVKFEAYSFKMLN